MGDLLKEMRTGRMMRATLKWDEGCICVAGHESYPDGCESGAESGMECTLCSQVIILSIYAALKINFYTFLRTAAWMF
jgi:hypothetical protein